MDASELSRYRQETGEAIVRLITEHPELETEILDIATMAADDGADNATNGFGYPVHPYRICQARIRSAERNNSG